MTPQIDPMSSEAQVEMEEYNARIVAHARRVIRDQKRVLRALNDQRTEE